MTTGYPEVCLVLCHATRPGSCQRVLSCQLVALHWSASTSDVEGRAGNRRGSGGQRPLCLDWRSDMCHLFHWPPVWGRITKLTWLGNVTLRKRGGRSGSAGPDWNKTAGFLSDPWQRPEWCKMCMASWQGQNPGSCAVLQTESCVLNWCDLGLSPLWQGQRYFTAFSIYSKLCNNKYK